MNKRMKPYRELDVEGAVAKIAELKRSLYDLRVKQAAGYLEKNSKLRDLRRDIARLETVRRQRAAGVAPAPKKAAAAPAEKPAAKRKAAPKAEGAEKAAPAKKAATKKAAPAKKTTARGAAAAK